MTGTNLYVNKCKQSRSYLYHLVHYVTQQNKRHAQRRRLLFMTTTFSLFIQSHLLFLPRILSKIGFIMSQHG